jgi:glycosyltransferase involved in cell wall biosynthesis
MDNKNRILFIYPIQFGYHTDTYKYCDHLRYKYEISYICFDQGLERIVLPEVNIIYLPYNTGKIIRLIHFFQYIIQFTRKRQFEILFTVQFKFCFIIGLFAKAKVKILDYRSGDLTSYYFIRKLKNWMLLFDALFFRNISVISEGLRDILHFNQSKTLILPLGGDVFSTRVHSYDRMNLLYVGHLHIRNIYQTIEGVALFIEKNGKAANKISYTILGFGYLNDEEIIRRYILKFKLSNIVQFLGRKKYTELNEYFDTCNIGVSYIPKTPYYEHQPATKTFEYINSGLFTIATNTTENRKVITDSNGVLCNDDPMSFSEALERVYNRMESISEKAVRSSLQKYLWSRIVDDILEPYLIKKLNES